jgi:hypothetical protein
MLKAFRGEPTMTRPVAVGGVMRKSWLGVTAH